MKEQLNNIRLEAEKSWGAVQTSADLESLRLRFLGKKGELTAVLRGMGALTSEERPIIGQLANDVKLY